MTKLRCMNISMSDQGAYYYFMRGVQPQIIIQFTLMHMEKDVYAIGQEYLIDMGEVDSLIHPVPGKPKAVAQE